MNLSHVERYFADFLSVMESGDKIKLYTGDERKDNAENTIDKEIEWPKNLFIIGTVNIDETTYMFSPKVLDRANVIEFRISPEEMSGFLGKKNELNMNALFIDGDKQKGGAGQNMAADFLAMARDKTINHGIDVQILNQFFVELQKVGAEFGYRSASEIELLLTKLGKDIPDDNQKIDIAVMQKLLPKLHGSRKKLSAPLETLAGFCLNRISNSIPDESNKNKNLYQQYIAENRDEAKWEIKFPISFEKIERMLKNAIENGFTSYAEA